MLHPGPPAPTSQTRPWSHLGWSTECELEPAPLEEVLGPWDGDEAIVGKHSALGEHWPLATNMAACGGTQLCPLAQPGPVLPTMGPGVASREKMTVAHG